MASNILYTAAALVVVLFAIHRGHSVSLGLRLGPRNRRKR